MKILIVSDTHGMDERLEEAVDRETPFDMLIHCGDIEGREFFIEALADGPCVMVAGNNDFFSDLDRETELTICGRRVLVTHGHYYGVSMNLETITEEARERGCEMVLFGHTHKPVVQRKDGILIVNPGSLTYPRQQGRRPSYAVMELDYTRTPEVRLEYL